MGNAEDGAALTEELPSRTSTTCATSITRAPPRLRHPVIHP